MKKLIILLVAISLLSCKDNKDQEQKRIDKNSTIALNSQIAKSDSPTHRSPRFIVDSTTVIQVNGGAMGFSEKQRDTINNRLLVWGFHVITEQGELELKFIGSRNVVFEYWPGEGKPGFDSDNILRDTIAYIPNSVLDKAEAEIRAAYDAGDFETVYTLFQDAYTFIPITGAEWRALKAQGIE